MDNVIEHFWSADRLRLVIIFIAGLLIGGYVTNQYVDPYLGSSSSVDYNALIEINTSLDERNEQLFGCLEKNQIDPQTC